MKKTNVLAIAGIILFGGAASIGSTVSDFYATSASENNQVEFGKLILENINISDPLFYTYPLDSGGDGLWQPGMKSESKVMAIKNAGTLEAEVYKVKLKQEQLKTLDPAAQESLKRHLTFKIDDTSKPGSSVPVLTATYGELLNGKDMDQSRILKTIRPGNTASYTITAELSREAGNELQGMMTEFDFVFQARDHKESK